MNIKAGELLAEIKANQERLNKCSRHRFDKLPNPPFRFRQKFKCQCCGGEMDALQAFAYALGYEAHGGDPNDIIANFRAEDDDKVSCPSCKGVRGVEVPEGSDDWHDCDTCDATGEMKRADALAFIDKWGKF